MSREYISPLTLDLSNVHTGAFAQYNAYIDYNPKDYFLKIVSSNPDPSYGFARKQPMSVVFDSLVSLVINEEFPTDRVYSFLDLLLVRTSEFVRKYIEWLQKLAELNAKVYQLEQLKELGCPVPLHNGLVLYSATADTENKIKEQFGGVKWRRVMNFPLLVTDSQKDRAGKRGGTSYTGLRLEHIVNHTHTLTLDNTNTGTGPQKDVWKTNTNAGPSKFLEGTKPGLAMSTKTVYPEIAALNWTVSELDKKTTSARYIEPHFNIPPYKDVYIWECVQAYDPTSRDFSDQVPMVEPPQMPTLRAMLKNPSLGIRDDVAATETPLKDLPVVSGTNSTLFEITSLSGLTDPELLNWFVFVSDELMQPGAERYESKDAPIANIADFASWYVWCKTLHIERRYLFKDTYKYLIEDIQDRIYLLVQRLIDAVHNTEEIPERLFPGQYIFFTEDTKLADVQDTYHLPEGYTLVPVSGVFLRGTSMFTEDTTDLYQTYNLSGTSHDANITVEGGLQSVDLTGMNFPMHLHWSTLLKGLSSLKAQEDNAHATGTSGSDLFKNDMRSGGTKYGNAAGTGPYVLQSQAEGTEGDINHNNIPKYITLKAYVVTA